MNEWLYYHPSTYCTTPKKHFRVCSNGTQGSSVHLIIHLSGLNVLETILHIN